jgi:Tfp pilus assembly protein FimT
MTSQIGTDWRRYGAGGRVQPSGITLIELILVMALLTIVAAVSAPHLTHFLSGRVLTEECARFVAVTHYARSEAISRGVPTEVWIDPDEGRYGLRYLAAETDDLPDPRDYQLNRELQFRFEETVANETDSITMLFWPDGTVDESSIDCVVIARDGSEELEIALDDAQANYAVREAGDEIRYAEYDALRQQ